MASAKKYSFHRLAQLRLTGVLKVTIASLLFTLPTLSHAGSDGVPLHGFADVGLALHSTKLSAGSANGTGTGAPTGFNVGSLDIYLAPQFDNNVKAMAELIFEVTPEGSVATDLERLQMGYTFSDTATLWAGRFHTPYGYWNTGFHHGAQIQTSISRPRFLDFEDKGGILPAHMVGLWSSGKFGTGDSKITYDMFAGNGPQIAMEARDAATNSQSPGILNINVAGDDNHRAMVGFNLGFEPSGTLDGLRIALHGLRGEVANNADSASPLTPMNKTEISLVGGSLVYLEDDWELLTELYSFNNRDASGLTGIHQSSASYLQIGRSFNQLTPFIRKEIAVLNQLDNYFNMQKNGQSYMRHAAGFKYDLDQKASLKLELQYSAFAAGEARSAFCNRSLYAQYAIRF